MKDHLFPKKLLYGELSQGKRDQGGQKKHFKDTPKVSMKSFDITPNCMEYLEQNRDKGREGIKSGVKVCETRRNVVTELHRNSTNTSATAATIPRTD